MAGSEARKPFHALLRRSKIQLRLVSSRKHRQTTVQYTSTHTHTVLVHWHCLHNCYDSNILLLHTSIVIFDDHPSLELQVPHFEPVISLFLWHAPQLSQCRQWGGQTIDKLGVLISFQRYYLLFVLEHV